MTREEEFNIIKNLIKKHIKEADCGLFDIRNCVGDRMLTIFEGEYFILDICYDYSYFEIFGTNDDEFEELENYYKLIQEED